MAVRERYARTWVTQEGDEISIGLEWRDDDELAFFTIVLKALAQRVLNAYSLADGDFHELAVDHIERWMDEHYPDRAFFVETERQGMGVQVFQPWGLPREDRA
jgi:hypothetical protein